MENIKQETAAKIWQCYREIETAKKLLNDLDEKIKNNRFNPHEQHLKDAFGHRQNMQLGIPSGENGYRLFDVSPNLAKSVIISHIAFKEAELTDVNEQARIEMAG